MLKKLHNEFLLKQKFRGIKNNNPVWKINFEVKI